MIHAGTISTGSGRTVSVVGVYWISSISSLRQTTRPGVTATCTPGLKASAPAGQLPLGALQVWIGADDGFPHRVVVADSRGNPVQTIDLSGLRLNPPLDDALFVFTPPPNANIQDLNARLGQAQK